MPALDHSTLSAMEPATDRRITETPWPAASQAWVALCAFCVAAILSYTDRQILSLLVDPLRATFRLSDTQVSILQGVAFALIYAVAGLPLGRMADVLPRRRVIIGGILIWSVATLWCGLARSFGELFLARALVGVGEAALAPAATSMIADYFPPRRRGTATGLFLMGQVAGSGLAITLGGAILQLAQSGALAGLPLIGALAPWRATLLLLSLPGLVVAVLIAATREPPRRHAPGRLRAPRLPDVASTLLARGATLGPIYLGMALLSVGDFSLQNWYPALLSRRFGLSPGLIGAELGPAAIASALVGTLGAGLLSDRRAAGRGVSARLPIAAVAAALALSGALAGLAPSAPVAIAIFMCWVVMSNAAGAIGITAVQELAPAPVRGVALALISFFNIGLGLGVGTTTTAVLTDKVFGGPHGVGTAMTAMAVPASVLGALAFLAAARSARRQAVAQ